MKKILTDEQRKLYQKKWREKNKEKLAKYHRDYRKNNPEINKINTKKYRKNNPDRAKKSTHDYKAKNKNKIKKYAESYKARRRELDALKIMNDPLYALKENIRKTILKSFKKKNFIKTSITEKILGCSYIEFKAYIESKFESWMTWENRGLYNGQLNYGWDLDHIIPISNATTEGEVKTLNHFTNFQPLCSKINRDIKRNFILANSEQA